MQWVLREVALVGVLFVAWLTAVGFGVLSTATGFVPDEDKGVMLVNMQLPDASSISRSKAAMDKLAGLIAADPAVETVTAITGFSVLSGAMASNSGTVFVVLKHS